MRSTLSTPFCRLSTTAWPSRCGAMAPAASSVSLLLTQNNTSAAPRTARIFSTAVTEIVSVMPWLSNRRPADQGHRHSRPCEHAAEQAAERTGSHDCDRKLGVVCHRHAKYRTGRAFYCSPLYHSDVRLAPLTPRR